MSWTTLKKIIFDKFSKLKGSLYSWSAGLTDQPSRLPIWPTKNPQHPSKTLRTDWYITLNCFDKIHKFKLSKTVGIYHRSQNCDLCVCMTKKCFMPEGPAWERLMYVITQGHMQAHHVMSVIFHSVNPARPEKNLGWGCSLLQTLNYHTVFEQTFGYLIKLVCKSRKERLKCSMKRMKKCYGILCS